MNLRRAIGRETKLADPATRTPPKAFCIWKYGKIDTVKGTFLFDRKSAASVMDNWKDWGNRLTFDYEHKATKEDGRAGDGKSAGSCLLSLQSDGLYATDVRWTPQASTEISGGEWLYFSPTFLSDEKTDRILDLINIALTNIPATKGMTPLVTASKTPRNSTTMPKKKLASANAEAEKKTVTLAVPVAAPVAGHATPEETAGETDQPGDMDAEASAKAHTGKLKAAKSRLAEAKLEMSLAQAEHDTICKSMSEDVDEDANKEDEESEDDPDDSDDGCDDDDDDSDHEELDGAAGQKDADPSNELDEEDDMPAAPFKKKSISAPVKTSSKLSAAEKAILSVTGESDLRRGVGKLYAMGVMQSEAVKVARRSEFDELSKKYAKPGSLTPKMEKLGRDILRTQGVEAVETFLTGLSVVATTEATKKTAQRDAAGSFGLSVSELDMCKRMGNDPETFAKQKSANEARSERRSRGEE